MNELNFQGLATELLGQARNLLPVWLPGGRLIGREYSCSDLRGGNGDSFKVNVDTGRWADFAGTEKGGDLISLFAAIEGIGQGDAFKRLSDDTGYQMRHGGSPSTQREAPQPQIPEVIKPPEDEPAPDMFHPTHGDPSMAWTYCDSDGSALFYIARYDTDSGKQIVPWSWGIDGGWIMKGWPAPRPLYGLKELADNPTLPVLIVEGEKTADFARQIFNPYYVVVTWPNGSKAVNKADWSPLYGRSILIWPDADEPGMSAAEAIAEALKPHCKSIKIVNPCEDQPQAWDLADAVAEGWTWEYTKQWAKDHLLTEKAAAVEEPTPQVEPEPEEVKTVSPSRILEAPKEDDELASESTYALQDRYGIPQTKQGTVICNVDAILRLLDNYPNFKDIAWYDEFQRKIFTTWITGEQHEWGDTESVRLMVFLQREVGMTKVGKEMIEWAIWDYAQRHKTNELRDWLDSLTWDETPRVDDFFVTHLGAGASDYIRTASKNWWIGMIARAFRPGCQMDNMVILEGGQGTYKSTALGIVGGRWYTEAQEPPTSKDFYMTLHGKLIVEIAELDSFRRVEDTLIKRLLTCRADRFRPPYARHSQDFPRQCIFVGTTNEDMYLKDHTGARRFWPIKIGKIEIKKLRDDREQLFAEAVHRFKNEESWWEMPDELTKEQQENRREGDEWEKVIQAWLNMKALTEVATFTVGVECLNIEAGRLDLIAQRRICKVMKALGWSKHNYRRGDVRERTWRSPTFYYEEPPF